VLLRAVVFKECAIHWHHDIWKLLGVPANQDAIILQLRSNVRSSFPSLRTSSNRMRRFFDVYPSNADFPAGVDLNIADSIVRARYRNNPSKAELLQPGKPYEFTIEMYPTSLLFQRGHRIPLDISSSNFPRFHVNPNYSQAGRIRRIQGGEE